MPTLRGFKDGILSFSDGSTRLVPHWGDSSYVTFFMVRHCERLEDGSKNPDLTPQGQARAERLADILKTFTPDTVYATPYRRTQQTAEPVQRRSKSQAIVIYAPENQTALLEELVASAGGKHFFIAGHQNTVPMALNYLKGDFMFDNIPDFEFDHFYVAVSRRIGEAEVLELRY